MSVRRFIKQCVCVILGHDWRTPLYRYDMDGRHARICWRCGEIDQ